MPPAMIFSADNYRITARLDLNWSAFMVPRAEINIIMRMAKGTNVFGQAEINGAFDFYEGTRLHGSIPVRIERLREQAADDDLLATLKEALAFAERRTVTEKNPLPAEIMADKVRVQIAKLER